MGVSMKYAGDGAVRKVLELHACPIPFHVVRMRFLGEIASPSPNVSPLKTIESLWAATGGMPVFASKAEAASLHGALLGLWNHMSRYQKVPVKVHPLPAARTLDDVAAGFAIRRDEITQGFIAGCSVAGLEDALPDEFLEALAALARIAQAFHDTEQRITGGDADGLGLVDYATLLKGRTKHVETFLTDLMAMAALVRKLLLTQGGPRLH